MITMIKCSQAWLPLDGGKGMLYSLGIKYRRHQGLQGDTSPGLGWDWGWKEIRQGNAFKDHKRSREIGAGETGTRDSVIQVSLSNSSTTVHM